MYSANITLKWNGAQFSRLVDVVVPCYSKKISDLKVNEK